jgi:hypothetical protein
LGAGIHIPTRTLPTIETGARLDIAVALIRKLWDEIDQIILVGEQLPVKALVEHGEGVGLAWRERPVHVVTGAEYVASNYQRYMGGRLGHTPDDPSRGSFTVSFGLSEIANSVAFETPQTQALRRLARADPAVRARLYGPEARLCAAILQYNPRQYFMETTSPDRRRGELILTTLDPGRPLPLIRYNTRDVVDLWSYERTMDMLKEIGRPDLRPPFPWPLVVVWGKNKGMEAAPGRWIYPEEVKEALYADDGTASRATGFFRMKNQGGRVRVAVQLRPGVPPDPAMADQLRERLAAFAAVETDIALYAHDDYPHGADPRFDRKAVYL